MGKRNSKLMKVILLTIDAIAIIAMVFVYKQWAANNKADNISNNTQDTSIVWYDNFSFSIPNNIKYTDLKEGGFVLENDDFIANVEVFIDENHYFLNTPEYYYQIMRDNGYMVDEPYILSDDFGSIIVFNYPSNNTLVSYFEFAKPYWVEVVIKNNENSQDTMYLEKVYDILNKATYDDSKSSEYQYSDLANFPPTE